MGVCFTIAYFCMSFIICPTNACAADGASNAVTHNSSDNLTYELLRTYEPSDKYQQDQGHRSYYCVRTKGDAPYFAACHIDDAANISNKIKLCVREFPGIVLMGCLRAFLKDQTDAQKFQAISDTFFDTFNPKEMHTAFNKGDQQLIRYVVERTQQFGGQRKSQLIKELNSTHRPTSAAAFAELWSTSVMVRAEFWLAIARYTHASDQRAKESAVFEFIPKGSVSDEEHVQSGVMHPITGKNVNHAAMSYHAPGMQTLNKAVMLGVDDITMLAYDLAVYAHLHPTILDRYKNHSHTCMCVDFKKAQAAVEASLTPASYPEVYNKRESWLEAARENKKEKID